MSRPFATIDTSVLVSLQCAELLGVVTALFDRLLVPAAVRGELEAGGESNRAALMAIDEFAVFERCDDYDPASVKMLLDTRKHLAHGKDAGEAEAVIQASQRSASMVLVDDPLGRDWAQRHTLECHGTIWLCRELRRRGFLRKLQPAYVQMLRRGRRQPLNEMNRYLQEFDEPLITDQEYREHTTPWKP